MVLVIPTPKKVRLLDPNEANVIGGVPDGR